MEEDPQLSEERQRVLALVEAGKISGEEATELIAALGQSRQGRRAPSGRVSNGRWVMLAGGLLVLAGFFLPWYRINIGEAIRGHFDESFGNMGRMVGEMLPVEAWQTVSGGDINYGLGWIVLIMGVGVAMLPLFWPTKRENRAVQRGITWGGLLVGGVLLAYVACNELIRWMHVGMAAEILGYLLLAGGAAAEYLQPRLEETGVQTAI